MTCMEEGQWELTTTQMEMRDGYTKCDNTYREIIIVNILLTITQSQNYIPVYNSISIKSTSLYVYSWFDQGHCN